MTDTYTCAVPARLLEALADNTADLLSLRGDWRHDPRMGRDEAWSQMREELKLATRILASSPNGEIICSRCGLRETLGKPCSEPPF